MSQMLAEISRIVSEDISSRVSQYDVLYEAIINSIHANATDIKCYLSTSDNFLNEDGQEIGTIRLDSLRIVDNGDGLTDENYKSFSKYRTDYKKKLGCKGVGRFVFLKVYDNAKYRSSISGISEERTILFNVDFDTDNLKKTEKKVRVNETEVLLSRLNNSYRDFDKKIDRRIELNLDKIKERVLSNLIPTLFFYKKKKKRNITIEFISTYDDSTLSINPKDIPEFKESSFKTKNRDGKEYNFHLFHKILKEDGNLNTYYCANNRAVCSFEDKDLKISMPYGYSGLMLLEAKYLDNQVNNERNDFDIFPVKTDLASTISWEMINNELKKVISKIVTQGIPETKKINKDKLKEIQEERPYLVHYIDPQDIEMAGYLDKRQIIEKAKKKFDIAKENVLNNSKKEEFSDKELNDAIQLAQNELVSYINDRVIIIEKLKMLVDKSEQVESIIHNLFMTKYTTDDYYSIGKNNLWLLDDRFTTYSYAASDRRIQDVLTDINEIYDDVDIVNDKPDLSLFFSHNPNNPDRLKSVILEIKPFDFKSKSDRKKYHGITQLIDYVKAFKEKERIQEVSGYLVTEIDEKLADRLLGDDYTPLFSTESPIYHRHYDKLGISIFVISAKTLIYDAEARNKIFLDIIKKQNRLKNLLSDSDSK
jgi:hypothetical protein